MEQHAQMEEEVFDEVTGELLEWDESTVTAEKLPNILRAIRAIQRRHGMITEFKRDELERVTMACDSKLDTLDLQISRLSGIAETLFKQSGQKKIEYPSIGTIRVGTTREKVDSSGWDNLTPDQREDYRKEESVGAFFRRTETFKPDKKAILGALQAGREDLETVFSLIPKQETVVFKAD